MHLTCPPTAERPHPNVFCIQVLLTLLGQLALHMLFLISSVKESEEFMPHKYMKPDSEFESNVVNNVSYMASMMIRFSTFAVNYMGHPFNQSISENKPFRMVLVSAVLFFTLIVSDLFTGLNALLGLVSLPMELRYKLLMWGLLMLVGCYTWERFLRWAFPAKMPKINRQEVEISRC